MSKVQSYNLTKKHNSAIRLLSLKDFGRWTLDLGLLFLLVCFGQVSAQENKCVLKLADLPDSPSLFGFRAGMTMDQVKLRVPQIVFGKANEFGVSQTSISPDFDPRFDKASFVGIRTVSLDFLDSRLTSLWLGHDNTYKWQTVPDYVKGISETLKLPNAWAPWKTRGQRLSCADFEITLTMLGEGPSFRILDLAAENLVATRRQAKEELDSAPEESEAAEIVADREAKVYYTESCQRKKPIKETNLVVFPTVEEAEKAGFKLSRDCQ